MSIARQGEFSSDGLPSVRLDEIRTGKVALIGHSGILSGIHKGVREGVLRIGPNGLEGDHQAETFHGGPDKAVLHYDSDHYADWAAEFPEIADKLKPGGFGENLVAAGLNERTICIGDYVRVGAALLQVSESRQPCFKLNHRFGQPGMARRAQATGRTGWLYRVIEPGEVEAGNAITVVERPLPDWSIARLQHYLYDEIDNLDAARTLSELPYLSAGFKALFKRRLENARVENWEDRLSNGPLVSAPVEWIEAEIAEIRQETPSVRSFRLVRCDGQPLPDFEAGAHIDLKVANSLTRSYSLCRLPGGGGYEIAVQRSPTSRGGSSHLHDAVRTGDRILITAPKNFFPLAKNAGRHVMIAGGIGITPFLAMIERLEADRADWELHYCMRSPADAAFHETLVSRFAERVHIHQTSGDPGKRLDIPALLGTAIAGTHVYCCGSAGLMDAVRSASLHWPDRAVHFESFGGKAAPGTADCSAFTAMIASTGQTIDVGADSTLLEALRASGFAIASSCEAGTCGTCRVGYRGGRVDHRDMVLSAQERKDVLITCVSRAAGDIVLDL